MKEGNIFNNTFNYNIIYVFKIHDELHKDILKVGKATVKTNLDVSQLEDNSEPLNEAAKKRIRRYTNTVGVQEDLLYTTLAINNKNVIFKDTDVHDVLTNSGIKKHDFKNEKRPGEWFETNLETVKNAIMAVKESRKCLNRTEVIDDFKEITFRPEQIEAIEKTIKKFEVSDRMLWNAKMRFGKTLSALEVIKRMSKNDKFKLKRAVILTHRPVVDEEWFKDFAKIFHNESDFLYGSKRRTSIDELIKSGKKFIYFVSMQDLRESNRVGGIYLKNDDVFEIDWDLIVIDEAHEGTKTILGQKVLLELLKSDKDHNAKQLHLSGTPFNLLSEFQEDEIYTWDYIMEQKAKLDWENNHPLEPNPYDDLPRMNIMTYDLATYLPKYKDIADSAFNFRTFFKVWTGEPDKDGVELEDPSKIGKFINENDVKKFLYLLSHESESSNYPFSRKEFRENFRHSFWILPGVKEARALKELLRTDEAFSMFDIVNVAGSDDENGDEALDAVHNAIGDKPEETYTITLSCGKLTTGVTVREWTAVLYLAGSFSTAASSYLQTIFRVQSPASFGGKQKTDCYVFDFAPDRTLKMIARAGDLSTRAGSTGSRETMKEFLNYCPVISMTGSEMKPYDVITMLGQLKRAYIERVADNGFDDIKIYNDNLYNLDENALEKFKKLKGIIGATKQTKKINEIEITNNGFNKEQWEILQKSEQKPRNQLTEEEKALIALKRERDKQRTDAISILRGISIRIPLMIYGADINDEEDITIKNLTDIVDDASWVEFMPRGVTKEMFKDFSQYYDNEIFIGAGRRIRNIVKHADTLPPMERAKAIADIFSTFRNPDKETVLTPWRTVNMHLGDTIGGYNFYDDKYSFAIEEPRLIINGDVTNKLFFNTRVKILELNSKTGLYPLYAAISIFKQRCLNTDSKKLTSEVMENLWQETLSDNVFVVCKTPMAKSITQRTLSGYKKYKTNILNIENIMDIINKDVNKLKSILLNPTVWHMKGGVKVKFDAIIGNPPYQETISSDESNSSLGKQLFPYFIMSAIKMDPNYISMITPSRWFAGDAQDKSFVKLREFIKNNNHISKIVNYINCNDVFDNVVIKGGVNYFLYEKGYTGLVEFVTVKGDTIMVQKRNLFEEGLDIVISDANDLSIIYKVTENNFTPLTEITTGRNAFNIIGKQSVVDKISMLDYKEGLAKLQCKNEEIRWIEPKLIQKNRDIFMKYKIFISKSAGDPSKDSKVIGKPYLGEPYSACTDSLIPVGKFDTKEEAINLQKYFKTKFLRYLVSILKVSQNVTQIVYKFVPMQNFSKDSDIDWTKGIEEIDEQLFKKYKFTDEEISIIKSRISY